MSLVEGKALPTSARGAVGFVKSSGRLAVGIGALALGAGLFFAAMPFVQRIPILGGIVASGRSIFPGQSTGPSTDFYGRMG